MRSLSPIRQVRGVRANEPRLRVYFDGWCKFCRRTARQLSLLDIMHVCEFVSFRKEPVPPLGAPAPAEFERRMQVLDQSSLRWVEGHAALRLLSRHVILLWPLRLLLAVADRLGMGDRTYDWIATRRLIVPDSGRCGTACKLETSPSSPQD